METVIPDLIGDLENIKEKYPYLFPNIPITNTPITFASAKP
jgi:hypothetical protein